MPFITEEIWQQLPQRKENESIMIAEFPNPDGRFGDERVVDEMQVIIGVVTALRNIRGEMNLPPGEQIVVLLRTQNEETEKTLPPGSNVHSEPGSNKGTEDRSGYLRNPSTALLLPFGMLRSLSPWTGLRWKRR